MVHRVLHALLTEEMDDVPTEADAKGFQMPAAANEQVDRCNEKKQASRKCNEQLDRAVFCIYLRSKKEWFYTIGTVLHFNYDKKTGQDSVNVYCAQLGKESRAMLYKRDGNEC